MNQHLLPNIIHRFAELAMTVRVDCHAQEIWQKSGMRILICVDGGRFRERRTKRGKRKKGQKKQGFHSGWVEPRLLSISQFDENGKKIKNIAPIIDGSCGTMDEFFDLLKQHLAQINLTEASQIIFCSDNGYTHAKQNISSVVSTIAETLKLSEKETGKLAIQIKNLLWAGEITGIQELAMEKLNRKRKAPKTIGKKLENYFGDHSKFQYQSIEQNRLPTGSGFIESAIRR